MRIFFFLNGMFFSDDFVPIVFLSFKFLTRYYFGIENIDCIYNANVFGKIFVSFVNNEFYRLCG